MRTIYLGIFVAVGVVLIAMAIPLIKRIVRPNWWYGFRVPSTVRNAQLWYPVNEYAGWRLLWVGVATIIVAVALYFAPVGLDVYVASVVGVIVVALAVAVAQSFAYLSRLKRERASLS